MAYTWIQNPQGVRVAFNDASDYASKRNLEHIDESHKSFNGRANVVASRLDISEAEARRGLFFSSKSSNQVTTWVRLDLKGPHGGVLAIRIADYSLVTFTSAKQNLHDQARHYRTSLHVL